MTTLLPHLVNGVSLGLLFALIALGFMLIVGVMETINLAHGSLFALGMYVALFLMAPRLGVFPELQAAYLALPVGTRYAIALFLAPIVVGIFGMALELCMRRTYGRDPLYGLLLTFGAALVIEELIRIVWGSNEKQLPLPEAVSGAVLIGDLIYSRYRFFAAGFACVLIVLLWLFIEKPVGSGDRGTDGRHGGGDHRCVCVRVVAAVDVPAVHCRRELSGARLVRQEERAGHVVDVK